MSLISKPLPAARDICNLDLDLISMISSKYLLRNIFVTCLLKTCLNCVSSYFKQFYCYNYKTSLQIVKNNDLIFIVHAFAMNNWDWNWLSSIINPVIKIWFVYQHIKNTKRSKYLNKTWIKTWYKKYTQKLVQIINCLNVNTSQGTK